MHRRHPGWVAALALAAVWLQTEPGRAQQPVSGADVMAEPSGAADAAVVARAEAYAAAAYEAYQRKEYVQAVALYEQALSVAPNAALVLYNIARIYDVGLHSRGLAIDYYHRFIAAPGAAPEHILNARARIGELEAAERAAVNQSIALEALQQREAALREATVPAAPAEVVPPSTALEPRAVAPSQALSIQPAPRDAAWTSQQVAALAVGGAGVASVGVGVGYLLSARAKRDIWKRDCDGNACSTQRAVDAAESASRQAAIGSAGLVAGGALLALGGVLWFVDFSSGKPTEGPSAWSLAPVVGRSEVSAALSGSF
jgi:tetratricopeptide (TPR) repeat protein